MSQTRGGAKTGAGSQQHDAQQNGENAPTSVTQRGPTSESLSQPATKGRKRQPSPGEGPVPRKRKSVGSLKSSAATTSSPKDTKEQPETEGQVSKKPRLTTPDLEFEYDRSQLRDPRPTPGRKARPRYRSLDIPEDMKAQLEATREIPRPEKPPGRLNSAQKDRLFTEEARMNPIKSFHDLHRCHDKGREGSPTYDDAGFQLDYNKVAEWMKPRAYNKQKMVRGMDRAVAKAQSEEDQMYELFFVERPKSRENMRLKEYVKDHVSKDLNIPWHQIKPEQVKMWRDQGFQPVKYEEWWQVPKAEEDKRMLKMMTGASLRKDL